MSEKLKENKETEVLVKKEKPKKKLRFSTLQALEKLDVFNINYLKR